MKYQFYVNPWAEQPVLIQSDSLDWIRAVWDALHRTGVEKISARP